MATRSEHVIKFRSDFRSFKQGFTGAQRAIGKFASLLSGLGVSVGAFRILGELNKAADQAAKWTDTARAIGSTATNVQRLQYAAEQLGGTLDDAVNIGKRFEDLQTKIAGGSKTMIAALAGVGLTPGDIAGLKPDALFTKMMGALGGASTGAAMQLMPELGPRAQGFARGGFGDLMGKAPIVDAAKLKDLSDFDATLKDFTSFMRKELMTALAELAPELKKLVPILKQFTGVSMAAMGQASALGKAPGQGGASLTTVAGGVGTVNAVATGYRAYEYLREIAGNTAALKEED